MPRCIVAGCGNKARDGVSLHSFPQDVRLRNAWTRFVKLTKPKWKGPTKYSSVCSEHFEKQYYVKRFVLMSGLGIPNKKRLLIPEAVPSICSKAIKERKAPEEISQKELKERTAYRKREVARIMEEYTKKMSDVSDSVTSSDSAVVKEDAKSQGSSTKDLIVSGSTNPSKFIKLVDESCDKTERSFSEVVEQNMRKRCFQHCSGNRMESCKNKPDLNLHVCAVKKFKLQENKGEQNKADPTETKVDKSLSNRQQLDTLIKSELSESVQTVYSEKSPMKNGENDAKPTEVTAKKVVVSDGPVKQSEPLKIDPPTKKPENSAQTGNLPTRNQTVKSATSVNNVKNVCFIKKKPGRICRGQKCCEMMKLFSNKVCWHGDVLSNIEKLTEKLDPANNIPSVIKLSKVESVMESKESGSGPAEIKFIKVKSSKRNMEELKGSSGKSKLLQVYRRVPSEEYQGKIKQKKCAVVSVDGKFLGELPVQQFEVAGYTTESDGIKETASPSQTHLFECPSPEKNSEGTDKTLIFIDGQIESGEVKLFSAIFSSMFISRVLSHMSPSEFAGKTVSFYEKDCKKTFYIYLVSDESSSSCYLSEYSDCFNTDHNVDKFSVIYENELDRLFRKLKCKKCSFAAHPKHLGVDKLDDTMLHVSVCCCKGHLICSWIWYVK